ncbi:MAG: YeeE/YedE family protein, partial [Flavobacteriales bacterium]|nr:YeeE/YedE family protein [Flavobacteriales bacterium]
LQEFGINSMNQAYLPTELFALSSLSDWKVILILAIGGFMVGFGARYAGGCTSGHAISGLSNLQLPSLIAVIGFFTGGLLMVHVLFPFIF